MVKPGQGTDFSGLYCDTREKAIYVATGGFGTGNILPKSSFPFTRMHRSYCCVCEHCAIFLSSTSCC